jgi:hypothetical protein
VVVTCTINYDSEKASNLDAHDVLIGLEHPVAYRSDGLQHQFRTGQRSRYFTFPPSVIAFIEAASAWWPVSTAESTAERNTAPKSVPPSCPDGTAADTLVDGVIRIIGNPEIGSVTSADPGYD